LSVLAAVNNSRNKQYRKINKLSSAIYYSQQLFKKLNNVHILEDSITIFLTIAKPLYDLLKKDKEFSFEEKKLECFETLKKKLVEAPVLGLYCYKCTSAQVFGAVLLQKKEDIKWHPIFYYSKATTKDEAKYHSFELETFAILYALRRFRIHVQGK